MDIDINRQHNFANNLRGNAGNNRDLDRVVADLRAQGDGDPGAHLQQSGSLLRAGQAVVRFVLRVREANRDANYALNRLDEHNRPWLSAEANRESRDRRIAKQQVRRETSRLRVANRLVRGAHH